MWSDLHCGIFPHLPPLGPRFESHLGHYVDVVFSPLTAVDIAFCLLFLMQVARHTRPEGRFEVRATIILFQRSLPPTPRAETGLPPLTVPPDVDLGIINLKPGR